MCFRPAGVSKPIKCPKCQTFNKSTNTQCQKCGYAWDDEKTPKKPEESEEPKKPE